MPEYFDCTHDVVVERAESTTRHAPTPWRWSRNEGLVAVDGTEIENLVVGPEDAEFICRAVNTFPALVEALKALVSTHDAIVGGLGKSDPPAITQARAALTLAGVETK